ncbi:MAG: hypothetical protein NTW87_17300 [Planctomycetota bacterium]|nr:hypothetical protein [Planctomycetota bacterium]
MPVPTEPPGPFAAKADANHDLKARISSVTHGASAAGKLWVDIELNVKGDKPLLPSLGVIRQLVLDSGVAISCEAVGGLGRRGGGCLGHIRIEVPDDTHWLRMVDGSLTINRAKKRETLVWENPLACRGQALTAGGITITLVDYQQDAATARAVIHVKAPPERDLSTLCEEFSLREGKRSAYLSGGGGRAPEGVFQYNLGARLGNLTVKTLEANFVSEIETEEVPFHLENLALPTRPETPSAATTGRDPALRRATVQCTAQGFTLGVKSVEVIAGDRPGVSVYCMAVPNAGTAVRLANVKALQAKAVYDTGAMAETADKAASAWAESWVPMSEGRLYFEFDFPAPPGNAVAFSSLSGVYRAFVDDETKTAEFTLPKAGENVTDPVSKGPVTLLSVTCANDTAVVTWAVDSKATLPRGNWPQLVSIAAFDEDGASLHPVLSRRDPPGGGGVVTSTFAAGQRKLARVVASYPTKGAIREIPFEFKNVDLPRKAGKIEFAPPEF